RDPQLHKSFANTPGPRPFSSLGGPRAREPLRGAPRSVANLEFHRAGHEIDDIGAHIVATLEARGITAVTTSIGFLMEINQSSGYAPWTVSPKPIAVEAGLGHMGIH